MLKPEDAYPIISTFALGLNTCILGEGYVILDEEFRKTCLRA